MTNRTYLISDASFSVISNSEEMKYGDTTSYKIMLDALSRAGFTVTKDPRIEKEYPILSDSHDAGSHGELKFESNYYPLGFKFEFYQDVVFENSNGGKYDFNKESKMPYLIKKRYQLAIKKLEHTALQLGFKYRESARKVNPAKYPLEAFNIQWDMGEMARGTLRFDRGPHGWPSDKEINSWCRKDADGMILDHGDEKYLRDSKGYLLRGRVYGGINGRWMFVYGKNPSDVTHASAYEFFSCNPSEVNRKVSPYRKAKLSRIKDEAIKTDNFEKAALIRDLLNLEFGKAA